MTKTIIHKNKRLAAILFTAAGLLSLPLIAMRFTHEVNWTFSDFLVMGILLFGTGMICELILRKFKTVGQRIAFCGITLAVFFLIWAELAVGIFNSLLAGN